MTKTESKKRIHELYEKHYGKGKKKSQAVKEAVKEKATILISKKDIYSS